MDDTFSELKDKLRDFVARRDWEKFHTPKNLSMSIAIEAGELMELFQWITTDEAIVKIDEDDEFRKLVEDEMADVLIYLFAMSLACDIDLKQVFLDKLSRNEYRFPPVK